MVSRPIGIRLGNDGKFGGFFFGIAALLCISSMAPAAELDLSPRLEPYELEGVKLSQLVFENGTSHKAIYQPPPEWKYSGGRDYLDLLPQNLPQAKAKVTKWPSPLAFDPDGCKRLTQQIVESLPEGSTQIKILSEESNPLQIDGHSTYLVQISYLYYGERYDCYSLLLNRKAGPLCFRLICRESDYQKLREAFQKSLYSWQNL